MKVSLCLALLLLFAGCATTSRYETKIRTWEGKKVDALLNSWGQPDSIEKLSNGDRMFVYARLHHEPLAYGQSPRTVARAATTPTSRTPASVSGVKQSTVANRIPADEVYIECATYFEVDQQNVIVSTLFRGDECKSDD